MTTHLCIVGIYLQKQLEKHMQEAMHLEQANDALRTLSTNGQMDTCVRVVLAGWKGLKAHKSTCARCVEMRG